MAATIDLEVSTPHRKPLAVVLGLVVLGLVLFVALRDPGANLTPGCGPEQERTAPLPNKPLYVWREVEPGVYQAGMLSPSLGFTPTDGKPLIRLSEHPFISVPLWTLSDQTAKTFPQLAQSIQLPKD